MKTTITLPNFGGFYGETFTDSYEESMNDGSQPDVEIDYKATYLSVAKGCVMDAYRERFEGSPFSGLEFVELDSPRFYNYRSDEIVASIEFEMDAAVALTNEPEFAPWLTENYSSRDGFWSFITTDPNEFRDKLLTDTDQHMTVLVEYYFRDMECIIPDALESVWEDVVLKANEPETNE